MLLYSVQPLSVWNDLSQGRVVTATPFDADPQSCEGADEAWREPYTWLSDQMRARGVAGLPNEPTPAFPMWAWHWYNGWRSQKPDLRTRTMRDWSLTHRMVLLHLDIDASRVLLSDYDGWHWCLNYWYLGRDRETRAFQREVKEALNTSYFKSKPLPDPGYDARLRKTWERMFDLPAMRPLLQTSMKKQIVQATLWQLTKADVISAVEFGMHQPSHPISFQTHPHLSIP